MFFEKSILIKSLVSEKYNSIQFQEVLPLILGGFIYFYLFEFIKNKNIYSFIQENQESKYFSFLLSLFGLFNFAVFPIFLVYLVFSKIAYLEAASLIALYLCIRFFFVNALKEYPKILFNYYSLVKFSSFSLTSSNKQKYQAAVDLQKEKLIISFKSLNIDKIDECVNEFKESEEIYLFFIYEAIVKIIHKKTLILRAVFFLSLISIFYCVILDFSLLSTFYVQFSFMYVYFVLSSVLNLPRKVNSIQLLNGNEFYNVYIVEDSPKGHIITLDSTNSTKKILKSSILYIE
ncbi:hypothetical protein V7O61_11210 [Methanolobus sp. WCC1]|uniref:hypothetical protein n=1 Tax=Methanolobus sp. WCC1 TaxID=3125782 RepID=UPI0032451F9A